MNLTTTVNQKQLLDLLLNVGIVRPVFIWGPPGIGKSSIVEQFAQQVGLPCVSLLGSQLAPEDIIGVPQIVNGRSVFCPPRMIASVHCPDTNLEKIRLDKRPTDKICSTLFSGRNACIKWVSWTASRSFCSRR